MDKIIERRVNSGKSVGFGATNTKSSSDREIESGKMVKQMAPDDLLKFGLIPEFIGRVPIYTVLEPLDEDALIRILTEPKNAILKQYKELLNMDNVSLEFDEEAVKLIAQEAIKRKTGARALRSIVEEIMLDIMYEIPSRDDIKVFRITPELVKKESETSELIVHPNAKMPKGEIA